MLLCTGPQLDFPLFSHLGTGHLVPEGLWGTSPWDEGSNESSGLGGRPTHCEMVSESLAFSVRRKVRFLILIWVLFLRRRWSAARSSGGRGWYTLRRSGLSPLPCLCLCVFHPLTGHTEYRHGHAGEGQPGRMDTVTEAHRPGAQPASEERGPVPVSIERDSS